MIEFFSILKIYIMSHHIYFNIGVNIQNYTKMRTTLSVLNSTNISNEDIVKFLEFFSPNEESPKFNISPSPNDNPSIVFLQTGNPDTEHGHGWPVLKKGGNVLYIYLLGYNYTVTLNMVGCEIIYSANPPDYKIEIPDFTRLFGSIKNFNEIKNNISDISILYKVTKTCEELKNKYRVFDRYKEMLGASKNNTTHRSYADIISYSDHDIQDFYEQTIMKYGD